MTGLMGIMLISVLIQVRFLPWNAPLANVADAASCSLLLMLDLATIRPSDRTGIRTLVSMIVLASSSSFFLNSKLCYGVFSPD